jgi:hypothetical protein
MPLDEARAEGEFGHIADHNALHARYNDSVDILSGTTAARPAAGAVGAGTLYWDTDTEILYRSDGSSTWDAVAAGTVAAHDLVSASHTASGLTSGHVLRATGATTFAFGALQDADVPSSIARDSEVTTAISNHEAAGDPHAGYRLESADHSHASSGAQGGQIAHSDLTGLTSGDPHTQYLQESIVDAKGDLIVASADNTPARLAVGANDTVLTADSAEATGVKWAAAAGGGPTFVYKTADESLASNTTPQDDDHLSFTTVASGIYAFEAWLKVTCAAAGDFRFQWVEPDGTFDFMVLVTTVSGGTITAPSPSSRIFNEGNAALVVETDATEQGLFFRGLIVAGGAGGTFKLQWAQGTSSITNTTVEKGSWLSYKKLN